VKKKKKIAGHEDCINYVTGAYDGANNIADAIIATSTTDQKSKQVFIEDRLRHGRVFFGNAFIRSAGTQSAVKDDDKWRGEKWTRTKPFVKGRPSGMSGRTIQLHAIHRTARGISNMINGR